MAERHGKGSMIVMDPQSWESIPHGRITICPRCFLSFQTQLFNFPFKEGKTSGNFQKHLLDQYVTTVTNWRQCHSIVQDDSAKLSSKIEDLSKEIAILKSERAELVKYVTEQVNNHNCLLTFSSDSQFNSNNGS